MRKRLVLGLAALTLLLSGATRARAEYIVTDLGTLGGTYSYATGLNDAGQVVGNSYATADGVSHAFVYSGGQMTALGSLLKFTASSANGINASGQVVGQSGYGQAVLYTGGKVIALGGPDSSGLAINASGQVAGFTLLSQDSHFHAVTWSAGQTTVLGSLHGGDSTAFGINASGQVVGTFFPNSVGPIVQPAFLYSGGKMINLGTLGGSTATATGINDAGQVVGFSAVANNAGIRAFLYSGGKMTDLGSLAGPDAGSSANGINNAGQVVGQSDVKGTSEEHAFLFINGKMTDLNSLLPANSGWTLIDATAINNKGQIAGYGINSSGAGHAFLLTPVAVPEPGSLALLSLGALGLAGHAWRKRWRRAS